ncbi:MAG TPA: PEGA domain-containing protein [Polyangiaceae bacterium]|nr:PEGA domain-containing protein [Polyangiaceae bacterium]
MTTFSIGRGVGFRERFIALALASTLASSLVAPAALAQDQPQAENVAAARSLGQQGIKLADAGDCKGAIEKLSRAESLYHAPTILGRLGECQVQVGQIVLGTENLNRVVREQLALNAPKAFKDAQERAKGVLNTALPKIARLTVKVDPADAKPQVLVGGSPIPAALIGVERPTDPGTHEVVVTAPGYLEQKTSVTLTEGGTQEVALKLEKDPNAAAAQPEPAPPPPVVVAPPPAPPADTSPKKSNALAYVALGVGGAGMIVGGVSGFLALGKKSDLDGCVDEKCPSSQKDTLDSAKTMATVSTIGFAVGFVGVGAGVVLLLTGGGSSSANLNAPKLTKQHAAGSVHVAPWFGAEAAGLQGTF